MVTGATGSVTKNTEFKALYMDTSGRMLCDAESFGGSDVSKGKAAIIFRGHAIQEEQLLVSGYSTWIVIQSLTLTAITFFRRVGNQSQKHIASHRCENLKFGTVIWH